MLTPARTLVAAARTLIAFFPPGFTAQRLMMTLAIKAAADKPMATSSPGVHEE